MTPPLDTNKGEPMKTLPEILSKQFEAHLVKTDIQGRHFWEPRKEEVEEAQEAIAKELMGCLPEKKTMEAAKSSGSDAGWGCTYGFNEALDEVRARLTAFIGHKEK